MSSAPGSSGCATTSRGRGSRIRTSSSSPSRRSTGSRCRCSTATACSSAARRAATGEIGEDVTHNLRTIAAIPLRLDIDRSARAGRGARRGLHVAAGLRRAQRAPRPGRPVDVHEPAQLGGRDDPPARSQARRRASAVVLGVRDRRDRRDLLRDPLRVARSGCATIASRSIRTSASCGARRRSSRSAVSGRSAAARSSSRSTASSSRSTTSSCSAGSASSDESRAGRSRGSSRRRPPSRRSTAIGWNPGKFGDLHPVRDARARPRRRRHDQARDAPQRGGSRAQGPPRGGGGDRAARRRRDPAGRLARAACRRASRSAAAAAAAGALSRLRHADGQARGLGVHAMPQPAVPRPAVAAAQALRRRDGHRRPRREAGQPVHGPRLGADGR